MAFWWECVCVERDEGIFGVVLLEGVVKGKETREVIGVGDECCPDFEYVNDYSIEDLVFVYYLSSSLSLCYRSPFSSENGLEPCLSQRR